MASLSVIVPTLNEETFLEATLAAIPPQHERFVVDGGSTDGTVHLAKECGAEVVVSPRAGRARQLNLGAERASGDLLLFLHADTIIPTRSLSNMLAAMAKQPDAPGGGFVRYFDRRSAFLKVTCFIAGLRGRLRGIHFGDQAIFARRETFDSIGGFEEDAPMAEDLIFSLQMRKLGKPLTITPPILSSGRRFETAGPVRQTMEDFRITNEIIREWR